MLALHQEAFAEGLDVRYTCTRLDTGDWLCGYSQQCSLG